MTDSPVHMRHMPDFVAPLAAIVIDHAEGSWVYATDGTKWLDFVMGIAVMNTRRPGIIAFQGAFHGRTHLTMALTDSAVHYRGHHEPLVGGIYHARYCYPY